MLREEAVSKPLLNTLIRVMEIRSLQNHRLVGGTALALQLGHRISIDIDLFSDVKNNYISIEEELLSRFGSGYEKIRDISGPLGNGITVSLNNIKTDIIDCNARFLLKPYMDEGIRMADKEDIVPMKLHTFLCSPEFARYEKKDYVDIAALLTDVSLSKMITL